MCSWQNFFLKSTPQAFVYPSKARYLLQSQWVHFVPDPFSVQIRVQWAAGSSSKIRVMKMFLRWGSQNKSTGKGQLQLLLQGSHGQASLLHFFSLKFHFPISFPSGNSSHCITAIRWKTSFVCRDVDRLTAQPWDTQLFRLAARAWCPEWLQMMN